MTLTWDFAYDAKYRVLRAEEKDASYEQIADAIETTRYVDNGLVKVLLIIIRCKPIILPVMVRKAKYCQAIPVARATCISFV